jgi:hypothetical protein
MRLAILALTLFSGLASADTHYDKFLGAIGSADFEGDRVDVPLYRGPHGSTVPYVQVSIGDGVYLFGLRSAEAVVYISERVAKEQEITLKTGNKKFINLKGEDHAYKPGGKAQMGQLDALAIGGLTLNNLAVASTERKSSEQDAAQGAKEWYQPRKSGTDIDGYIGLGALPADISWAVLPSEGVVRFSRQGEGLIAGGSTIPYAITPSEVVQWGKRTDKFLFIDEATVQGVTIGGVEMPGHIEMGVSGSWYHWPTDIPSESKAPIGDVDVPYLSAAVGGLNLGSTHVLELTAYDGVDRLNQVRIGQDLLYDFDIAMDRSAGTLTLKKATAIKRADPLPFMLEYALYEMEKEEEKDIYDYVDPNKYPFQERAYAEKRRLAEQNKAEQPAEGDSKPPGTDKDWSRLMDIYQASGDLVAAAEAAANAVALDERDCTDWRRLGQAHKAAGNIADAIVAFEKSSELYHAWYDMPLAERKDIKKTLDKLEGEEKLVHEYAVASDGCHSADADLAEATFAAGDLLSVETLYRKHMDLDANLGLIAGNALITQGEYAHAQEPLRQALKKGGTKTLSRLSLAVLYAEQGDWDTAAKLFDRVLGQAFGVQTLRVWMDALSKAKGEDAMIAATQDLNKRYPDSISAKVGLAYALSASDHGPNKAKAQRAGEHFFKARLARVPDSAATAGKYARWLNQWEPGSDAALAAAERGLALDSDEPDVLIALAEVHAAREDAETATKWTIRAGQSAPLHIGYARLLTVY